MIDRTHDLSIARQAKVLNISRGCVYYKPKSASAADLALMRRINELHLEYPFAGSRMLRDFLNREGVEVGRRHVGPLMKRMGIKAIYRKANTSKPTPRKKIYPYLLRGLKVERPNPVRAMDISRRCEAFVRTYIPMARGFVYLARWKRPWRNMGRRGFLIPTKAVSSSEAFTSVLIASKISIRMDGKGAWRDNVERIWKSVKYEEVYLNAHDSVSAVRASIGRYLDFYNRRRPHSSLDRRTPDEAYFDPTPFQAERIFRRRALAETTVGLRPSCVTPNTRRPDS